MLPTIGAAFAVTLAATPLVREAARHLGLLDRPNARSSHEVVTPRSGGLAVLAGLAAGVALSADLPRAREGLWAWLLGGAIVTLLGLLDDRFGLPAWPRLAGQVVAAALVVGVTGGLPHLPLPAPLDLELGLLGPAVGALWIVAVINFFNFMDGIDGLAALQAVVTSGGLALAFAREPFAGSVAAALAAASLGFLVFNWAPASVFLGDAGSGLLGYTLASLPLLVATERRPEAIAVTGASLFLFLADASVCLIRRIARGEKWYEAHREHFYQRWVRAGASHAVVASALGAAAVPLTALAVAGWQRSGAPWTWLALLAGTAMLSGEWALVRRLERQKGGSR
jgi:Fuc2NAc and GlcNAc transferase